MKGNLIEFSFKSNESGVKCGSVERQTEENLVRRLTKKKKKKKTVKMLKTSARAVMAEVQKWRQEIF